MLIYNHKKEFVGIDEKDLKALKVNNLAELRSEAADFADLFVKTPGYIHNFKQVHWLDFIASADSLDENKVIISIKGKNYKALVDLKTIYLVDAPAKKAYLVELNNIRELTKEENEKISGDLAVRVTPKAAEETNIEIFDTPELSGEFEVNDTQDTVVEDPYASSHHQDEPLELDLDDDLFMESSTYEEKDKVEEEALSQEEEEKTQEFQDIEEKLELPNVETLEEADNSTQEEYEEEVIEEDYKFSDYTYDPHVASSELGLPVDLVEEFIQDFIAQSNEFKPDLYEALDNGRVDSVRMLSHKLKGVAANLRIEDAFDALVTINTSDDMEEVRTTLDRFYNIIIRKLSGEEPILPKKIIKIQKENKKEQKEQESQSQEEPLTLTIDETDIEDIHSKPPVGLDEVEITPQEEEIKQTNNNNDDDRLDIDLDLSFDTVNEKEPKEELLELPSEEETPQVQEEESKEELQIQLEEEIKEDTKDEKETLDLDIKEFVQEPKEEEQISKEEEEENQVSLNFDSLDIDSFSNVQEEKSKEELQIQLEEEPKEDTKDEKETLDLDIKEFDQEPKEEEQISKEEEEENQISLNFDSLDIDSFSNDQEEKTNDENLELESNDKEPKEKIDETKEDISNQEEQEEQEEDNEEYIVFLDPKKASLEMGIAEDFYLQLLDDYIADVKMDLEKITLALNQDDEEKAKKIILRLKGMSDNMRISDLSKDFEELFQTKGAKKQEIISLISKKINFLEKIGDKK